MKSQLHPERKFLLKSSLQLPDLTSDSDDNAGIEMEKPTVLGLASSFLVEEKLSRFLLEARALAALLLLDFQEAQDLACFLESVEDSSEELMVLRYNL